MARNRKSFWIALIEHSEVYRDKFYEDDHEDPRIRLWNGYIGWKLPNLLSAMNPNSSSVWEDFVVDAHLDNLPELTEDEMSLLNQIARENGGHPSWKGETVMDFSDRTFEFSVNFTNLILVAADFKRTTFNLSANFYLTRFFMPPNFREVEFLDSADFSDAFFETHVSFLRAKFRGDTHFYGAKFNGGATFSNSRFEQPVKFDGSEFREKYFLRYDWHYLFNDRLAEFDEVEFQDRVSFHNVNFGENPNQVDERKRLLRLADFSDARFRAATDFSYAVFNGAPSFFNCELHGDTDFSGVKWCEAIPTNRRHIDHDIRAWERLELMMNQLEKPFDRQIFYRLKMRTRRFTDSRFLRMFNWLFDVTCDYGWSISRGTMCWSLHWLIAAVLLFLNTGQAIFGDCAPELFIAALGTAFANAHAFLGLAGEGGYLESCRLLIKENDQFGIFTAVGVVQAVLGPIILFLLLLTLRNRFRLA